MFNGVLILVLLAAATGACAGDGGGDHPTGAADLVVRIEAEGGLLPPMALVERLPSFSMYGDGSIVTPGPELEIYPGPALPNLRVQKITQEGVAAVVEKAAAAGLADGDDRYENRRVADAGTTVVTVVTGGRRSRTSAYALEVAGGENPGARRDIKDFIEWVGDLRGNLPGGTVTDEDSEYEIDRIQVVSIPGKAGRPEDEAAGRIGWPLARPLSRYGKRFEVSGLRGARCEQLRGSDALELVEIFQAANDQTRWVSEGRTFTVLPRPLLPDETGCRTHAARRS